MDRATLIVRSLGPALSGPLFDDAVATEAQVSVLEDWLASATGTLLTRERG